MSDTGGVAREQLTAFIERIERLEEEKKTIADDVKDVYAEAKANGTADEGDDDVVDADFEEVKDDDDKKSA